LIEDIAIVELEPRLQTPNMVDYSKFDAIEDQDEIGEAHSSLRQRNAPQKKGPKNSEDALARVNHMLGLYVGDKQLQDNLKQSSVKKVPARSNLKGFWFIFFSSYGSSS